VLSKFFDMESALNEAEARELYVLSSEFSN